MAAGGKPLWYLEMFTTFSILFLTIFFVSVVSSWSSGLKKIIADPAENLGDFPEKDRKQLLKNLKYFDESISGASLYCNLIVGFSVGAAGIAFAYLLYKEKIREIFGLVWFGLVSGFTLVWMVTTVVFYVALDEVSGPIPERHANLLSPPLSTIHKWGRTNLGSTIQGLVVWPTVAFLFLSFVAYRLHVKLSIFGNTNPDTVGATETKPGSWFDRKSNAQGGTWERETDEVPLVEGEVVSDEAPLTEAVLVEGQLRSDSMTGGWAPWLEDVFDYTF